MANVHEYFETKLTREVAEAIARLVCQSFTTSIQTPEQRTAEMLDAQESGDPEKTSGRRFVIWNDGVAVAHTKTFVRTVSVAGQQIPVLALAAVCSDPAHRGRGLGATITKKAFEQIGQPDWPNVSLFQTPVPDFYAKLNCRLVDNRFVNRRNFENPEANPWRDEHIMIYPAEYSWPQGTVDLNGPDY